MMGEEAYARARKMGLKEYHNRIQKRVSPYLPVLEEIDEGLNALSHVPLGLVQIPLKKVVGTASKGRTNAFAANFMPILDPGSEFSSKWGILYEGIVEQGLNQPVKVLEYLNQYYLVEGNKRVSVMKYLDSIYIEAEVTRVLPKRTDDPENALYFEYLPFYADTGINYLWFSRPGSVAKLYELTGKAPGEKWTSEERSDFLAAFMRFRTEYKLREASSDPKKLPATTGDAFLIYLQACGYADAPKKFEPQLRGEVKALWGEFEKAKTEENVELIMKPDEVKGGGSILNTLFGPSSVKVAFLYSREPSQNGWTYWHDLGRINMENELGDKVKTAVSICEDPDGFEAEIERLIAEGNQLIFTTTPPMLSASMKASVKHPEAKILNCSMLASWQRVRSYYVRLYEVKFLIGMIAGALTENDKVGYIGDYPIVGAAVNQYEPTVEALLAGESADAVTGTGAVVNGDNKYCVYVYDTDGNPVEGAFIQFCDDATCAFQPTDANGLAEFRVDVEKVYEVHVIQAPEGFRQDERSYETLDSYCDVNIFLERAE